MIVRSVVVSLRGLMGGIIGRIVERDGEDQGARVLGFGRYCLMYVETVCVVGEIVAMSFKIGSHVMMGCGVGDFVSAGSSRGEWGWGL